MQRLHPVICQHAIWGSKQQRFRHCKLPAKLDSTLVDKIQQLELQCFPPSTNTLSEEEHQAQVANFLSLRTNLLQPYLDMHRILCGHHQKEAQAAQAKQDEIEKAKREGTYQDPDEAKRIAKEQQMIDPTDIPKAFLEAIERVFSKECPSEWARRVLDQFDGPEEWKSSGSCQHEHAYSKDKGEIDVKEAFPCHASYERLFSEAGTKKKRHLAQESQLIQSMSTLGLLKPVLEQDMNNADQEQNPKTITRRPVFVEFGAGTGGLSRHLQLVLETIISPPSLSSTSLTTYPVEPFNFVLLDRQKFRSRNQVDYMIRTQPRPIKPRVLRITKDVRELTLDNLQLIHEVEPGVAWPDWTEGGGGKIKPREETTKIPTHFMCISKHFCGPATDLALSWIREQKQGRKDGKEEETIESQDLYSICFATCCHGICEPSLVVAKPYLLELLNSSILLTVIKKRKRVESEELDVNILHQDNNNNETTTTTTTETLQLSELISEAQLDEWIPMLIKLTGWATLGREEESSLVARPGKDAVSDEVMPRNQRRILGKRCKKLLDMARCMYLIRECGFREAKSIEYTTESVESGAIVGTM
ncbi:tRNA:m4X modification enzyme [Linnemannia zychae]|nr:tRNA:m4X modification enzyme [Linnemannia zychae]